MVQQLEFGISHLNKQVLPFFFFFLLYSCLVRGTTIEEQTILTLENESICYWEEQSSLSLGCTPFWNFEQTAQSSCDNHSSTLWEVPPEGNTGPAGLDIVFEVLLGTGLIKFHNPCGEWETCYGTERA